MDALIKKVESCGVPNEGQITSSDRLFLLHFTIGVYFGPDLKGNESPKSVLQRLSEQLPSYSLDQLAGTYVRAVEVKRIYYYVLRNVDKSLTITLPFLHRFFNGTLGTDGLDHEVTLPQFSDLFPSELHPQSKYKSYRIIENITFIKDPITTYLRSEDIERFKRLTGLENLALDREITIFSKFATGSGFHGPVPEAESAGEAVSVRHFQGLCGSKHVNQIHESDYQVASDMALLGSVPYHCTSPMQKLAAPPQDINDSKSNEQVGPGVVVLPSCLNKKEQDAATATRRSGFTLTGSAAMAKAGPILGLVDIGECDDAYLFRVSLPGVKRDEKEFSCKVEIDGKVIIKGVTTTGERTVCRFSQVFEMLSKNLSPPGQFSIEFQLPGPVIPQQFLGNFGTDGVLEGIVMKEKLSNL